MKKFNNMKTKICIAYPSAPGSKSSRFFKRNVHPKSIILIRPSFCFFGRVEVE